MANGSAFRFAGVAQSGERPGYSPREVAGSNPAPRSIRPFPRPQSEAMPWPSLLAAVALAGAIAIIAAAVVGLITARGLL
jgi:hypothetical protein